jgi:alkylation response protein AidB-like acyl-CoA dehydrogenase
MDWSLNPSELYWHERARELGDRFASRAADHDRLAKFPWDNWRDLQEAGFLALAAPADYGGQWDGYLPYALSAIEIARGDASTMCALAMHFGCVFTVLSAGTEKQRREYLPQVAEQGRFFGVATTDSSAAEPGAPTEMTAKPVDGGWRLNGRRHFVTSAGAADWLIVRAKEPAGTSRLLIAAQAEDGSLRPGVQVERIGEGLGLRASATYSVQFDDYFVSEADELASPGASGESDPAVSSPAATDPRVPGGFFPVAGFSIGLAATVLGPAIAAYEWSREALQAMGTAKPASVTADRRRLIAEMHVGIESARGLLLQAAWMADNNPARLPAAIQAARYHCTQQAAQVTQKAMVACGGRSYLESYPLERYVRDALAGPLQAGCYENCPQRLAHEILDGQ